MDYGRNYDSHRDSKITEKYFIKLCDSAAKNKMSYMDYKSTGVDIDAGNEAVITCRLFWTSTVFGFTLLN